MHNFKGLMTGYGVTDDWISEYEKFLDGNLKRFSLKVLYLFISLYEIKFDIRIHCFLFELSRTLRFDVKQFLYRNP